MKINLDRVIKDIENLKVFNSTPDKGITRLAFSEEDKMANQYIKAQMVDANLHIYQDGYGNLFGRREGENPELPPIIIGSHYDTVINGGPFDGMAGVITGIEIMRVLSENNISHNHSIEVVAFNDEEGVRFRNGISNSRAIAGLLGENELDSTFDKDGISLRDAMVNYGITPDLAKAKREKGSIKAYLELHIEQGPVLINEHKDVGIVETIVGLDRYELTFTGMAGHAGTTPMIGRQDALIPAARFILALNKVALEVGEGAVGTVGEVKISPNAANVIPGIVTLSVDLRATTEEIIIKMKEMMSVEIEALRQEFALSIEVKNTLNIQPVNMSPENCDILVRKAQELGIEFMMMNSGAGHDAMIMAAITPSSLVFVPSKDGLSHHPDEWTDYEALEKGMELLLHTVIEVSR